MKKNVILLAPLILLFQYCSSQKKNDPIEDKIKKVETGLISQVYFEGDSTWTIEERMKHYHVPGVSIAVINGGKIEWAKSYGVMDEDTKEPVTNQTLFQAGSISKPVAAYAALKMVEEGKIDINENVNTYLKTWKLPDNEFTKDKKVALKHLLSHTGGITVHGFLGYSTDLPVPTLVQVLDGLPPANSPAIRVDKAPETGYRYSGGGYTIMQQMVMDIEGKPFPEILKEKVLQPLEMNNSTYDQPLRAQQLKMAATGYLPNSSMTKGKRHTYPEMAAAGLWTTAEDLAKFAINIQQTLKGKTKILSKEMTEKMLTPFGSDFDGLGLFIDKRKGDIYFGHGGWDEGFSSQMTVSKDKGYGVVVLTNSNHPPFIDELIRAVARTYNWGNYVPVYKKMAMDSSALSSIVGRYKNNSDGLVTVLNEGNRLFIKYLRSSQTELFRIGDGRYIGYEDDRLIQFKTNPANGLLCIQFVNRDGKEDFAHPKLNNDEKVPYEFLLSGDYNNALKGYQAIMKADPKDDAVNEDNLNNQGYQLMSSGNIKLALDVFKINTMLYPASANVYDSYGEACAKNGDTDMAIANYKKALALDPKKESAIKMLAELQKGKAK